VLFGREVLQPRLIAWYGDVPYRYSGRTLDPSPMIPPISAITEQVSATCETEFNHVLLNRYRDGNDSMGRHRDDEPELGDAPTVATLSLGARRRFSVYRSKQRVWTEGLGAGDLLVMRGRFQHELAHELPKQRSVKAERISLTFRKIAAGD
jgi:alkylated DNA repair dioxygenase AlkB